MGRRGKKHRDGAGGHAGERARAIARDAERDAEGEPVRQDVGYREAPPSPARPVRREADPRPEAPRPTPLPAGVAEHRQLGTAFVIMGAVMALGMAAIGVASVRRARVHAKPFERDACTVVESRDVPGEGGGTDHVVAFEHRRDGRTYRGDRYSPDHPYGPGASWLRVGSQVDCYCVPDDPATCFLDRGNPNAESGAWSLLWFLPAVLLGLGVAVRSARTMPVDD